MQGLKAGRPDEFVKKIARNEAQHIFGPNLCRTFSVEKVPQRLGLLL
jgi:hypothetical protein